MTRDYELMTVLHPDLDATGIQGVMDALKAHINESGEVAQIDFLGLRRLAYLVRRCTHGHYVLCNFTAPPSSIESLRRLIQVDHHDRIIRYLLILDEKRGSRPTAQALPGATEEDEPEETPSRAEELARAAAERAALEEAARAQAEAAAESESSPEAGDEQGDEGAAAEPTEPAADETAEPEADETAESAEEETAEPVAEEPAKTASDEASEEESEAVDSE